MCLVLLKKFKNYCISHVSSVYSIDTNANLIIHQKNDYLEQGSRKGKFSYHKRFCRSVTWIVDLKVHTCYHKKNIKNANYVLCNIKTAQNQILWIRLFVDQTVKCFELSKYFTQISSNRLVCPKNAHHV